VARKKIVYVIVEGPSDETALGVILNRIYDKNSVFIEIVHGDITTTSSVYSSNIKSKLTDLISNYAKQRHFTKNNFLEVIHLVDMDGAFAPDECILEDSAATKAKYTTTEIFTDKPLKMRQRNLQKRENLNVISSLSTIWGTVPYQCYYMSCNLDHVLYNKQNSTDDDKENDAHAFAKKYKDDIPGFLDFISKSDFSVNKDYIKSWEYIKQEKHSLERHTNLAICFRNIIAETENS
jgi:hypothetical protein